MNVFNLAACVFLFTTILSAKDLAGLQLKVMERQENCLASSSFESKVKNQISEKTLASQSLQTTEQEVFQALSACTMKEGIASLQSEEDLYRALTKCPELYQRWAEYSPLKILLQQELKDLKTNLTRIQKFIRHTCLAMR